MFQSTECTDAEFTQTLNMIRMAGGKVLTSGPITVPHQGRRVPGYAISYYLPPVTTEENA